MTLTEQKNQVEAQLELEKGKGADKDIMLIAELETKQAQLLEQIMIEEQNAANGLKIQQDHEERVTKSTDDFFSKIDNLPISNGMTLRDMIPDEDLYQASAIEIKGLFQTGIDDISRQLADLQRDLAEANAKNTAITSQLNQERLDHAQTKQYQSNAANLLEEANREIEQLKDQLKSATANVKTTNTEDEQKKKAELDAKIKLTRTIYNRVADNVLFPKVYTANLAANGEQITFPSYAINSYIVIEESEVSQFRADNGIAETTVASENIAPIESMDEQTIDVAVPEVQFPVIPQTTLHTTPATVESGDASEGRESGQAVTREEFEALKADVEQLKASASRWVA